MANRDRKMVTMLYCECYDGGDRELTIGALERSTLLEFKSGQGHPEESQI